MTPAAAILHLLIRLLAAAAIASVSACAAPAMTPDSTRAAPELIALYERFAAGEDFSTARVLLMDGAVRVEATALREPEALLADLEELGLTEAQRFGVVIDGWLPIEAIPGASRLARLRYLDAVRTPPRQPVDEPRRVPPRQRY